MTRLCCLLLFIFQIIPTLCKSNSTFSPLPARLKITLTGFTRARTVQSIISEVNGRCILVTADVGETIGDNGIFARIDSTFIKLDLKANNIALGKTRRQLEFDQKEVIRYRKLVATKASAQARLDGARLQRDQTRLNLQELQTRRERLRELLTRHAVTAPVGFRIISRMVEPGQWVTTGQTLARVGDYRHLLVPIAVTTKELHRLQQKKRINLTLPDEKILGTGTLLHISPAFDPTTRKINVDILLTDKTVKKISLPQGGLRVEIPIKLMDDMHSFLVPASAVEERYEEHWLTRTDGSRLRVVVLGPASGPVDDQRSWLRITAPGLDRKDTFLVSPDS